MMQPVPILGQQSYSAPSPALNFNPSPAVNPMMQPVSVLDQQVFNPSQPALNFDPFSSFNVDPSPAFNFNPSRPDLNFDPSSLFNVEPSPSFNFNPPPSFNVPQLAPILDQQNLESVEPVGPQTPSFLESIKQTYDESVLANLIDRGFGQEVFQSKAPDGTPTYSIYNKRFGTLGSQVPYSEASPEAQAQARKFMQSTGGQERPLPETPTSPVLNPEQVQSILNEQRAAEAAESFSKGSQDQEEVADPSLKSLSSSSQSPDTFFGLGDSSLSSSNVAQKTPRGPNAPMGRDATKALIARRFGLNAPATLNQAITNNPNAVMTTDAQGRMRSFASPQAAQQNLANAQAVFNQESLNRQIRGGGTGSYAGDSAARVARINERDKRPGETQTERDTRIADSRTVGADRGGEMSFAEARKFIPRGERESTKAYNSRVKAYQAQQNSTINNLKEQYEQYRVQGQVLNNQRTNALIANYQQTQPEKYRETYKVAQEMLRDGVLKDETQMAMYVIDEMGGKSSSIFDPVTEFMRGDDDGGGGALVDIRNIPTGAKDQLISDPSLKDFFDAKYGQGAADQVLGK